MGIIRKIDPRRIKEEDLPLVVLVDDCRSFIGWGIKAHSGGDYNHSMEMYKPGYFASQNFNGYKSVPVSKYLKPGIRLKFWKCGGLTAKEKENWPAAIYADLNKPWYKNRYDFLGILGQLLGIRRLNNPWTKYCSEMVSSHQRKALKMILPLHPSPVDLNSLYEKIDRMRVFGYWFED